MTDHICRVFAIVCGIACGYVMGCGDSPATPEPEAVASASASAIALPPGVELWVGRGGDPGRSWKAKGAEFATLKFPDGATADMRLVDSTIVITLDQLQVREVSAGGFSRLVRIEVKPAEATP